jgi:histidine triad (HIT) family protein
MDCIFCQIVEGKIESKTVYEDENFQAFWDISPQAPVHILIVPKKHLEPTQGYQDSDVELLGRMVLVAEKVAQQQGIFDKGFRLILNTGPDAGQEVAHLHLHLLGGCKLGRLLAE